MAPNRKSLTSLVQTFHDLEGLQQTVQFKYLPLTHPHESSAQQQHHQTQHQNNDSSASYWQWSSDDIQEETFCVLSTDNIVSNLIQASPTLSGEEHSSETVTQHDSYWAEYAHPSPFMPESDNANYWAWETSCSDIAQPIVKAAKQRHEEHQSDSDSYWAW